jgi:hypothetical protein
MLSFWSVAMLGKMMPAALASTCVPSRIRRRTLKATGQRDGGAYGVRLDQEFTGLPAR